MADLVWWLGYADRSSARLLVRSDTAGTLTLSVGDVTQQQTVDPAQNYGIRMFTVSGLKSGSRIPFTVTHTDGTTISGQLRTMPERGPYRVLFMSCIQVDCPTTVIDSILDRYDIHQFVTLGDTPYCDGRPTGYDTGNGRWGTAPPGIMVNWSKREDWDETYLYLMRNPHWARLCHEVPMIRGWDDHEVMNDWDHSLTWANDPVTRVSTQAEADQLYNLARQAYEDWGVKGNPDCVDPELDYYKPSAADPATPLTNYPPLYTRWTLGPAEFFLLDTMGHTCPNAKADTGTLIDTDPTAKTRIGLPQLNWIRNRVAASSAPHKFIMTPKKFYRSGATSDNRDYDTFVSERDHLAQFFGQQGAVLLTGDVHNACVNYIDSIKHLCINSSPLSMGGLDGGPNYDTVNWPDGLVWVARWYGFGKQQTIGMIEYDENEARYMIFTQWGYPLWQGRTLAGSADLLRL